jgi:outer membrane protein OmpA-like peptidoglycan-associated protein
MDSAPAAEENPFDVAMAEVEPPEPAPADEADEGDEVDEEMAGLADELGGGGEEENEGVRVEQVDEGVWITFDSRVLFGFDSHALRSDVHATLRRIATTLARHPDKEILVIGHTDATGPEQYNKKLSLKRAHAVAAFLLQEGVNRERITEVGRGEDKPVAGNDTREGRRANRRVEIAIYADRELKRAALEGMIDGTLRPELE